MNADELIDRLKKACAGGVSAVRVVTRLVPAGGDGDKVFPPTYEGGKYHSEDRYINGETVKTVVLDSVQSQANCIEEALANAFILGEVELPLFKVSIPGHDPVTTLTAPHRIYDAIFRDCELEGQPFQKSAIGQRLVHARVANATALYEFSPTVLFLGAWDSHSGSGVKSAKIPRALTSEIIGLNAQEGARSASRVDPFGIERGNRTIYKHPTDYWTFDTKDAVKDEKGKAVSFGREGKAGKPSSIGHGNITPSLVDSRTHTPLPGGVTISEAIQTIVLSFVQLRRLHFPDEEARITSERDVAGRAVIAALALYAVVLQLENGYDLRSRCFLLPKDLPKFEFVGVTDKITPGSKLEITKEVALGAFNTLREQAVTNGLSWRSGVTELLPSAKLVELVTRSEKLAETAADEDQS